MFYQIVDKDGEIFLQEDIYIDTELTQQYPDNPDENFYNNYREAVTEGVVIGEPNLLSSKIAPVFLPNGKFITIKEPQGGFHSLAYIYYFYDFAKEAGITTPLELENALKKFITEVFPYREDELFANERGTILSKEISGSMGILQVNFPHEWLDKKRDSAQKFYLRITDESGNILKEAYLQFVPYTQQ